MDHHLCLASARLTPCAGTAAIRFWRSDGWRPAHSAPAPARSCSESWRTRTQRPAGVSVDRARRGVPIDDGDLPGSGQQHPADQTCQRQPDDPPAPSGARYPRSPELQERVHRGQRLGRVEQIDHRTVPPCRPRRSSPLYCSLPGPKEPLDHVLEPILNRRSATLDS